MVHRPERWNGDSGEDKNRELVQGWEIEEDLKKIWIRIEEAGEMNRIVHSKEYKKLSYRRETARQLPTWRGATARPSSPLPLRPLWLHLCVWLNP